MWLENLEDYENSLQASDEPNIYFDEKEDIKKDCVEQIQKLMDFHCLDSIDRLIIFTRLQNLYTTEAEIAKLVGVTRQAISKRVRKLYAESNGFPSILFYKSRGHLAKKLKITGYKPNKIQRRLKNELECGIKSAGC